MNNAIIGQADREISSKSFEQKEKKSYCFVFLIEFSGLKVSGRMQNYDKKERIRYLIDLSLSPQVSFIFTKTKKKKNTVYLLRNCTCPLNFW